MAGRVSDDTPRVALSLTVKNVGSKETNQQTYVTLPSGNFDGSCSIRSEGLESNILDDVRFSLCGFLSRCIFQRETPVVGRVPYHHTILVLVNEGIWLESATTTTEITHDRLPAPEIAHGQRNMFLDHFGYGEHLPLEWLASSPLQNFTEAVTDIKETLRHPFQEVIWKLLSTSPYSAHQDCQFLFDTRMYRQCLLRSLQYMFESEDSKSLHGRIYLPEECGCAKMFIKVSE